MKKSVLALLVSLTFLESNAMKNPNVVTRFECSTQPPLVAQKIGDNELCWSVDGHERLRLGKGSFLTCQNNASFYGVVFSACSCSFSPDMTEDDIRLNLIEALGCDVTVTTQLVD